MDAAHRHRRQHSRLLHLRASSRELPPPPGLGRLVSEPHLRVIKLCSQVPDGDRLVLITVTILRDTLACYQRFYSPNLSGAALE